jgi:hypothetical protein
MAPSVSRNQSMMRPLRIAAAALCLLLAGCGSGKLYPKPFDYMHQTLVEVDDLPPVFGSAAPDLSMDTSDPNTVQWIVNVHGSEAMRFVAKLQPEGEKSTRMALDLVGVRSGENGDVEKRLEDHPELKRLYLVAMTEQIESKLEERPFDITRTYGALMAAAAANAGAIAGEVHGDQSH